LGLYSNSSCATSATGYSISGSPVSAAAGVATFTSTSITGSSSTTLYLQASSTGLTSACSSAISLTQ
jgi:hypothetical protein